MSTSKIVKLNVGGETFATSTTTLLSIGETFFSSLLSGRHESERDENGAYFIDRSPKYFGPILHYLRTNSIDIPSDYTLSSMRMEAEFYGMQKIVDHIDYLEAEKTQEENQQVLPLFGDVGCYVDDIDKNAFMFGGSEKLTLVSGDQAYTQAMVIHNHPQVPQEWSGDQSHARSFAVFYEQHVKKGKYKMNSEGRGMLLTLPLLDGLGRPKRGVVGTVMASLSDDFKMGLLLSLPGKGPSLRQHLATLNRDGSKLCVTSFSCTAGSGIFMCTHENPHHFHLYKFRRF